MPNNFVYITASLTQGQERTPLRKKHSNFLDLTDSPLEVLLVLVPASAAVSVESNNIKIKNIYIYVTIKRALEVILKVNFMFIVFNIPH